MPEKRDDDACLLSHDEFYLLALNLILSQQNKYTIT